MASKNKFKPFAFYEMIVRPEQGFSYRVFELGSTICYGHDFIRYRQPAKAPLRFAFLFLKKGENLILYFKRRCGHDE